MSYYSILKHETSITLTSLGFCQNFQNNCFPEHLKAEASVYVKRQNFENYILGKSQISSLPLFLQDMNLRADSDLSVYGCKHLLKKVEKIKQANSRRMLTSQRQDFAATNTDLLCILLLSTYCSLYSVIKESCIVHPHNSNFPN